MPFLLDEVACARLPFAALAALGDLRCRAGLETAAAGDQVWLRWPAGDQAVVLGVLAAPGVELFERRDGAWVRHGSRLPGEQPPADSEFRPLASVLFPDRVEPIASSAPTVRPAVLSLVREETPRPTTALRCSLRDLAAWADRAPSAALAAVLAARSENKVLLLGSRLPTVPNAERFWGKKVFVPLGHRPEPGLPESAILNALGVEDDEILILDAQGGTILNRGCFQSLGRAGVRLALAEPS